MLLDKRIFLTEFLSFSYYPFLISLLFKLIFNSEKRLPVEYLVRVEQLNLEKFIADMSPGRATLNLSCYVGISYMEINIHQHNFALVLNTFQRRKFMALPPDKNDEHFTGSLIFVLTYNYMLYNVSPTFFVGN